VHALSNARRVSAFYTHLSDFSERSSSFFFIPDSSPQESKAGPVRFSYHTTRHESLSNCYTAPPVFASTLKAKSVRPQQFCLVIICSQMASPFFEKQMAGESPHLCTAAPSFLKSKSDPTLTTNRPFYSQLTAGSQASPAIFLPPVLAALQPCLPENNAKKGFVTHKPHIPRTTDSALE
jgi:hypothetical protein